MLFCSFTVSCTCRTLHLLVLQSLPPRFQRKKAAVMKALMMKVKKALMMITKLKYGYSHMMFFRMLDKG
jgi:hypothetical protein